MGKIKGKRGKNARRARQGQLGVINTSLKNTKKIAQFQKKQILRETKRDEKRDAERLQSTPRVEANEEAATERDATGKKLPHSFVIHSGRIGKLARRLERDIRRVMAPNTSAQLKVTKRNNFKDFLVHAQFLGVSHILALTKSEKRESLNLRIIRNPQGPTIHFKIENYSLSRDILAAQKRPVVFQDLFKSSPLVVLSGFKDDSNLPSNGKHLSLVKTILQNMFPTIDIDTIKLKSVRRTLLINYNAETGLIDFRHYAIKAVPSGLSKSTKKIVQKKIPDMSKYADFSDFMLNPTALSDSEYEEEQTEVKLPQDFCSLMSGQQTKIRLIEIGPRMTWKLIKIEEEIDSGEVLFHSYVEKSAKEVFQLRKKAPLIKKKRLLHEKRVEHTTIRKLKASRERLQRAAAKFDEEKARSIRSQEQVTGESMRERDVKAENAAAAASRKNDEKIVRKT